MLEITLLDLLSKYRDCFSKSTKDLGKCDIVEIKIHLEDGKLITFMPYRSQSMHKFVKLWKIYSIMIIIRDSKSGEMRTCV